MGKKLPEVLKGTDIVQCSVATGGILHEVTEDGEYVSDVYVPPGRHRAAHFMVLIGRRHKLVPASDVLCYEPPQKTAPISFGEMHDETAASQTFRVDRADREKRRNDRLERRLDAFERREALQRRALERSRGVEDAEPVEGEAAQDAASAGEA